MGAPFARKYYVSGRVQGVGYRYFVQRVARDLGIRGWAKNLEDGRVEVLGLGTRHQLQEFQAELRVGPPHADVREVEEQGAAVEAHLDGFHIR